MRAGSSSPTAWRTRSSPLRSSAGWSRKGLQDETRIRNVVSERFGIVDSGERKQWDSGMVREPDDGKPLYALIPIPFLRRVAIHMTRGAIKYSRDNWRQANSEDELQ